MRIEKLFGALGCATVAAVVAMTSCSNPANPGNLDTQEDSVSYALGFNSGSSYAQNLGQFPGGDSVVNKDILIAGFINAIKGDSANYHMTGDEAMKVLQDYFDQQQVKRAKEERDAYMKSKAGNDAYLTEKLKEGFKELPNPIDSTEKGVLIKETSAGKGNNIKPTDFVYIDYVGKLNDGTIFDETTGKRPAIIPVAGLIPGFTQGLQQLKEGSIATIIIPSELGYGREPVGDGKIPANSVLNFDVDVLKVFHNKKEASAFAEKKRAEEEAKAQAAATKPADEKAAK